jgi:hypothetical protein
MTSYPRLLEGMLQAEASVDKVRLLFGAWFPRLSLPHSEASGRQHRSDSLAESVEQSNKDFFSAISNTFLKGQYRSSSNILSSRNLSLLLSMWLRIFKICRREEKDRLRVKVSSSSSLLPLLQRTPLPLSPRLLSQRG